MRRSVAAPLLLAAFALLASPSAMARAPAPVPIPRVSGVDQTPAGTNATMYGRCTAAVERFARDTSHWCKFNRMGSWPSLPDAATARAFKFGRLTVYNGPILKQRFACNVPGIGSDTHATVALSTRYLKTWEGGWHPTAPGACGRCVCVSLFGGDDQYNRGLQRWVVTKYKGLSFMGRVGDRMGEGADDSIDVLMDRPFSCAYNGTVNPNAASVNARPGLRGFTRMWGAEHPVSVGTWTALWQFVPCDWTHARCGALVASYGHGTWLPARVARC